MHIIPSPSEPREHTGIELIDEIIKSPMIASSYGSAFFSNNCIDFGIYSAQHIAKLNVSQLGSDTQHMNLCEQKENQNFMVRALGVTGAAILIGVGTALLMKDEESKNDVS